MPDYVIILLHYARTHTRLHACYMTKMICFPDYIIIIYMYILLHTYNYAITVYVLLRCIVSSICIFVNVFYILCAYYNLLSMKLMYICHVPSYLFIYLFIDIF